MAVHKGQYSVSVIEDENAGRMGLHIIERENGQVCVSISDAQTDRGLHINISASDFLNALVHIQEFHSRES